MSKQPEIKKKNVFEDSNLNLKGFYRTSGILLIIVAVIWSIVFQTARILYGSGFPIDPESYLQLISNHQLLASTTWSLWIVSDLLLMAPTLAISIILYRYNRTMAIIGGLFAMFFNLYDICVTELNSITLVSLSHGFTGAATELIRSSFISAATYGYYALPLQTVLSFSTGTLGYLLWCFPMFKSPFSRGTSIFGFVMCIIALIGSVAPLYPSSLILGLCQMVAVPACAVWFVLIGIQIFRYGKIQTDRL
jgi:hypothetical protein